MIKADTNPTTSCRALLAGAPAVAAAALAGDAAINALTIAEAKAADDPVFELIDQHTAAVRLWAETLDELGGDPLEEMY
jgi:hypothetical protein